MIQVVLALAALGLVVVAWPRALGGSASYMVVSGISMEPTLRTGDLVVARRATTYEVGDVIAFATSEGDVIHRIVGGDPVAGYVTQGDNVDRVDPYRPTPAEVHGRQVVRVPALGGWGLRAVRLVPAPLLGAAAVLLAVVGGGRPRRRRRSGLVAAASSSPSTAGRGAVAPPEPGLAQRRRLRVAAACVVAAVVVLPSAVVAWRAPLRVPADTVAGPADILSTTVVGLASRPSTLYPDGRSAPVVAGPDGRVPDDAPTLLRALVDRVEITVTYAREGDAEVAGSGQLDLALVTGRGFVLPLEGSVAEPFRGTWEATTTVALATVDAALAAYLAEAGLARDTVEVRATPSVVTQDGAVLRADAVLLRPTDEVVVVDGSLRTVTAPSAPDGTVAGTAALVGLPLPVAVVRVLSLLLLGGLLTAAGVLLRREQRDAPHLRVALLHGSLLVDIAPDASVGGELVRVTSVAELARLARRDHRSVLHQHRSDGSHRYLVPDGELTYEFVLGQPGDDRPLPVPDDAAALEQDLPRTPSDLARSSPVIVEDFSELARIWLRNNDAPGKLEKRRRADGSVRYVVVRDGRQFVYEAEPGEDAVADWRASQ